jgi:hypothetical protein
MARVHIQKYTVVTVEEARERVKVIARGTAAYSVVVATSMAGQARCSGAYAYRTA